MISLSSRRLEALGDALFAIVMTLLVLELRVPAAKDFISQQALIQKLIELTPNFLSFIISFAVLGIFWFGHRVQFHYIINSNRNLVWLNILFYLTISLIPFSAALLGRYPDMQISIIIYGVNLSIAVFVLYAHWIYGISNKHLCPNHVPVEIKREAKLQFLFAPLVYVMAIVVSFWSTTASLYIYLTTPIFYFLPNKLDNYLP